MISDDEYRRRIVAAEEWAAGRLRIAHARAKASFHIPASRSVRYRDLAPYFIGELARPEVGRIEAALQWVLEAFETDVYDLPREPLPNDTVLIDEALEYVMRRAQPKSCGRCGSPYDKEKKSTQCPHSATTSDEARRLGEITGVA